METQVKTHLEGISPLSHKHLLSCRFAGEGKSVVLGIREIACPQIEFADVQIGTNVSTQDCIELLGVGIGLVPPSLTLSIHIGPRCSDHRAYPANPEGYPHGRAYRNDL